MGGGRTRNSSKYAYMVGKRERLNLQRPHPMRSITLSWSCHYNVHNVWIQTARGQPALICCVIAFPQRLVPLALAPFFLLAIHVRFISQDGPMGHHKELHGMLYRKPFGRQLGGFQYMFGTYLGYHSHLITTSEKYHWGVFA